MKSLFGFLTSDYRFETACTLISASLHVILGLAIIEVLRRVIDTAIPSGDVELLVGHLLVALLLAASRSVSGWTRQYFGARLCENHVARLRLQLLEHITLLPRRYFAENRAGAILNRLMHDTARFGANIDFVFVQPFVSGFTVIISIFYLVSLNTLLGFIALFPIVVLLGCIPFLNKKISVLRRRIVVEQNELSANMLEVLANVDEIQNLRSVDEFLKKISTHQHKLRNASLQENTWRANLVAISSVANGLAPLLIYGLGGYLAFSGLISIGELVAMVAILGFIYSAVDDLVRYVPLVQNVVDRFQELYRVFDSTQIVSSKEYRSKTEISTVRLNAPAIEMEDVRVRTEDGSNLFQELNLVVNPGEKVLLRGNSGAGKSTLLSVLAGKHLEFNGRVKVCGHSVPAPILYSSSRLVAYIPQKPTIFEASLRDNLLMRLSANQVASQAAANVHDEKLIRLCNEIGFLDDLVDFSLGSAEVTTKHKVATILSLGLLPEAGFKFDRPDQEVLISNGFRISEQSLTEVLFKVGGYLKEYCEIHNRPMFEQVDKLSNELAAAWCLLSTIKALGILNTSTVKEGQLTIEAILQIVDESWDNHHSILENFENYAAAKLGGVDARISRSTLRFLIEKIGLTDVFCRLGLDFPLAETAKNLSGGQIRKIAFLRVALNPPLVLLLDEITAEMDEESERKIFSFVRNSLGATTVIVATHSKPDETHYDRVIHLAGGKLSQELPANYDR